MTESFLAELSPDELSGFRAAGRTRRFGQGETVFREGDDAGGVMAIVSGRMKVSVAGVGGREVVLQFPGPGDLVGELSPIFRRPRSASVVAMGDVEVIAMPAEGFRRFIADHPRVAMLIFDHVASLLSVADRQRVDLATRDVTGRVAARLLELADEADVNANGPSTLSLALSQDEPPPGPVPRVRRWRSRSMSCASSDGSRPAGVKSPSSTARRCGVLSADGCGRLHSIAIR